MPAPVSFNITLAPLPVNFEGDLQEYATAIIDRLTITPAEPWSSFQNGGAIGGSDVGPILFQGMEWRVWDSDAGEYTYHRQHGEGLIDNTVDLSKLIQGTAGSVFVYNEGTNAAELTIASGSAKQVLTNNGTAPVWAALPGHTFFEVTRAVSNQDLETDGVDDQIVQFNQVTRSANVTYDTTNYRIPVNAGEVWYFYCYVQLEDELTPSTSVQIGLNIRKNGPSGEGLGSITNYPTAKSREGAVSSGVLEFSADGYVDVAVNVIESSPESGGFSVAANSTNTRFGGFRIK